VVGANGTGKTTLLKLLTGEIEPEEGVVRRAKTLDGVIIDQQRKLLDPDKKVRDVLADGGDWIDVRGVRKHVQGYLKEFLFAPRTGRRAIGTLSGGERSRLLLAREFARRSNLLVLDEPTNDLDLETLDLLQEVIADYDGTVLIVSHDRDFLDRTVTITSARRLRQGRRGGRGLRGLGAQAQGGGRAFEAALKNQGCCAARAEAADQAHVQGPTRLRSASLANREARSRNRSR
jgi:ATP-binding cassette subfamily F protein uup